MKRFSLKWLVSAVLLSGMLALLSPLPAAADQPLINPHTFYWDGCALGIQPHCRILVLDAKAGEPEAQFRLGNMLLAGWIGNEAIPEAELQQMRTIAVDLIVQSVRQGHPPAVRWARTLLESVKPESKPTPPQQQAPRRAFPGSGPLVVSNSG